VESHHNLPKNVRTGGKGRTKKKEKVGLRALGGKEGDSGWGVHSLSVEAIRDLQRIVPD